MARVHLESHHLFLGPPKPSHRTRNLMHCQARYTSGSWSGSIASACFSETLLCEDLARGNQTHSAPSSVMLKNTGIHGICRPFFGTVARWGLAMNCTRAITQKATAWHKSCNWGCLKARTPVYSWGPSLWKHPETTGWDDGAQP